MTHLMWFAVFCLIIAASAFLVPGIYFTQWCWGIAGLSVAWLLTGMYLRRKGWIRR